MQLRLIVNNTGDIDGGGKSSAVFDTKGGIIGSAQDADWVLSDRKGTVWPHHLTVMYLDGQFCLNVGEGAKVYVNGSTTAVEAGEVFQIADGDEIGLGNFTLSVYVNADKGGQYANSDGGWSQRFTSVGVLVGDSQDLDLSSEALFEKKFIQHDNSLLHKRLAQADRHDPIEMMEEKNSTRSTYEKDPMAVFERKQTKEAQTMMTSKVGEVLNIEPEEAHYVELPDDLQPGSNYVAMPAATSFDEDFTAQYAVSSRQEEDAPVPHGKEGKRPLEREDVDSYLAMLAQAAKNPGKSSDSVTHLDVAQEAIYEADWQRVSDAVSRDSYLGDIEEGEGEEGEIVENALIDHVVLRPLCAALGLNISHMSQPQANRLAREIGQALKAAVRGLMAAHAREMSGASHLASTHLHAIEDNPLRLDIGVDEALKDMFLVQSPVHLSAEAAISESLELLAHHRAASDRATEAALEAILQALSPLALARRFMKYKGHAPRAGDLDAWHWNMYQHYYAEMRSNKQGGLSRMFWEVHHQIYDREMRHLTQEQA